jgi:cohesin complex subunit SCC1
MDLLASIPDPATLLADGFDLDRLADSNAVLDWGTQSIIADSIDQGKSLSIPRALDDEDLGLELGDELDISLEPERFRDGAQPAWRDEFVGEPSKLQADDLELDIGDDTTLTRPGAEEADIEMIGAFPPLAGEENGDRIRRAGRESFSPLSELRLSEERDLERSLYEPHPEDESIHPAQRIKRRRVIQMDSTLELKNSQIRDQQTDRSKTLKPMTFLPRDPVLLALLSMQKSGGFVSSILGDGRTFGWAPELKDVLSVAIVRKSGDLKRKRDSGVAVEMGIDIDIQEPSMMGELELGEETGLGPMEELPLGEQLRRRSEELEEAEPYGVTPPPDFDQTTIPLLHPEDAGPISLGTRHAVHLLRDHFGAAAAESPTQRQKTSVLFQELLPEITTSRSDATKMFFEVLVLATKDAVKVEQRTDKIGAPIRLRAKRGLWGAWAEKSAGGQISQETAGAEEE